MIFREGKLKIDFLFSSIKSLDTSEKIIEISKYFLRVPYKKSSLVGSSDSPEILTIDFEGVDCMTFIEYVEALRLSDSLESFVDNLKKVRYFDGIVGFEKRRHFFTDWANLDSVADITMEIGGVYCKTELKELNKDGNHLWIEGLPIKQRNINYIPKTHIEKIIHKLRSGDYCGFYTSKEGLDVIHVGIFIEEDGLKLRHASSIKGHVTDESFIEYVKNKEGLIILRAV